MQVRNRFGVEVNSTGHTSYQRSTKSELKPKQVAANVPNRNFCLKETAFDLDLEVIASFQEDEMDRCPFYEEQLYINHILHFLAFPRHSVQFQCKKHSIYFSY